MAERDLKKWSTFFNDAGVPTGPAAEYATLFCDHRIKDDLLGDLTKDILNDIGITVMGDIMSVLKHAKAVYAKLEREKASNRLVLGLNPKTILEEEQQITSSQQLKKKKAVLPKVVIKLKPPEVKQSTGIQPITPKKMLVINNSKVITTDDDPVVPKKRPIKNTLTLSERFASEAVPPSKISRLSTKITETNQNILTKKALGKTISTQQVTTQGKIIGDKIIPPKRKSAFERLGKEAPTAQKASQILTSKTKIAKLTKSPIRVPTTNTLRIPLKKEESSVFKRLGETESNLAASRTNSMTIRTVTGLGSRVVTGVDNEKRNLKSHSVLRPIKPTRAVKPVKSISPANSKTIISLISTDTKSTIPEEAQVKKSVFSRLGSPTY